MLNSLQQFLYQHFASSQGFMPHGHCYLWDPSLVWTHAISDSLIGLAYVSISITLFRLIRKIRIPFSTVVLSFGVFIGACGATHFMEVLTLWTPAYGWSALIKVITATASVSTGLWLVRLWHPIVTVAEAAKLSEQRRLDLEALTEQLETRVAARTAELDRANHWIHYLSETTKALTESLDFNLILNKVAHLSIPDLGDWCIIDSLNAQGDFRRVAVHHKDPQRAALALEFFNQTPDLNAPEGASVVMRTGQTLHQSELKGQIPLLGTRDPKQLEMIRELGISAYLCVPLRARNRQFGVITFVLSTPEREFTQHHVDTAEELGRRAGICLENSLLYQQAQQAIQARDEFLSIASHELKTPLTSLRLQSDVVLRARKTEETHEQLMQRLDKMLEQSGRNMNRLGRLIEDMLDVTRIQSGKMTLTREHIDLCALTRDFCEHFAHQAVAAGTTIEISDCVPISGFLDPHRIEQILSNLLSNAIRYGLKKPIYVHIERTQDKARLTVRDEGMGIDPIHHERIFERYERIVNANDISGLGLGLFIVQKIVNAHHGTIRVESELSKGATFIVELPLYPSEIQSTPQKQTQP